MAWRESTRRTNAAKEHMAVSAQFQAVKPNEVVDFLLSPHSLPLFDHASDLFADKALMRVAAFFVKLFRHTKIDLSNVTISLTKEGVPKGLSGEAALAIDEEFLENVGETLKTRLRTDLDSVVDVRALQDEKESRRGFLQEYGVDDSYAHQIAEAPAPDRYDPYSRPPPRRGGYYDEEPPPSGGGAGKILSSLLNL